MGDHVLMKTLLLTIFIAGSLMADANTEWVDQQVAAIKPPRTGVSSAAINRIKNPFIFTYPATASKSDGKKTAQTSDKKAPEAAKEIAKPMRLVAVLNNAALIDNVWYKPNDTVRGFTIAKIDHDSVILTKAKQEKKLFIASENPKIKIQTK